MLPRTPHSEVGYAQIIAMKEQPRINELLSSDIVSPTRKVRDLIKMVVLHKPAPVRFTVTTLARSLNSLTIQSEAQEVRRSPP
jgi:hypothetical protein